MKLRHFVSGSSIVLVGWLAATFIYDVPAQRYQKPDKSPAMSSITTGKTPAELAKIEPENPAVSLSH